MLEITIHSCYKCDLETINDPNNTQYFWINRRDLEIETKCNWQVIFDKYKDLSTQKYRKELTPNITFQPNKIFVRNDLFEKTIKSCKATNLEFLKLKEKPGLCPYEDICNKQELISMSKEISKEEKVFAQPDFENEKLRKNESEKVRKEESEKVRKEESKKLRNENEQLRKNNAVKDATIKESIEIKSLEEDENATDSYSNCFDKNNFKNVLAIIDSNTFNYRHKIGEFKYNDIKYFLNKIRNNAISEISAKKI